MLIYQRIIFNDRLIFLLFLETRGVIGITDITKSNVLQSAEDNNNNNTDIDGGFPENTVQNFNPQYNNGQQPANTSPATEQVNDDNDKPNISPREFVESLLENAVDRQNDILDGLSDVVKETFTILRQRETTASNSEANIKVAKVLEKQQEIIVVQNKRLDQQNVEIATMSKILQKVTLTHDMMADSKFY